MPDVRVALKPAAGGPAAAVDYIDYIAKNEGMGGLVAAVQQAFAQDVRVNASLVIQPNERNPITFLQLASLIGCGRESSRLLDRAEELEDLFRHLFYDKNRIRIDRLLWQYGHRVAVAVFAYSQSSTPEARVVVCGVRAVTCLESGNTATVLTASDHTTHFAGSVYLLEGAHLGTARSLADMYRTGPDRLFHAALKTLFRKTLAIWHQRQPVREEGSTLGEMYRSCLGLTSKLIERRAFERRLDSIVRRFPTIGLNNIDRGSGTLTVRLGGSSFSYPDPVPVLYQKSDIGHPLLLTRTPGRLSAETVLADAGGSTWLTDFSGGRLAPVLSEYVALEAAIRFDFVDTDKVAWLHEMERCLVTGEFGRLAIADVEAPLRKTVRTIQFIRQLASQTAFQEPLAYHFGIFFEAARRLASFDPASPLTPKEIARLAHLLIGASLVCTRICSGRNPRGAVLPALAGIRIDKGDRVVTVDGVHIVLRGQGFRLACYLHDNADRLCTRRELIEHVRKEIYNAGDHSQVGRLNTAIRRLRERIEEDPDQPRYLLTEPGGYRLLSQPKDRNATSRSLASS